MIEPARGRFVIAETDTRLPLIRQAPDPPPCHAPTTMTASTSAAPGDPDADGDLTRAGTDTLTVGDLSDAAACWMTRMLQNPLFQRLSPAHLQALFRRMTGIDFAAGEVVVRQGEPGDYCYFIVDGRCEIVHEGRRAPPLLLAELSSGDCFGEDALISDLPRSATVTMRTAGRLMRLSRADFIDLISGPMMLRLNHADAAARIGDDTADWLDVRPKREFDLGHLPGSVNLPLMLLRLKCAVLDHRRLQICVCDTGQRSAVAAFVLSQRGFDTAVLDGGLDRLDPALLKRSSGY